MAEVLIAAFSALVAAGALAVSYAAHRHQVRRAAVLDEREARIEGWEGRLEQREREADRREARTQASLIAVRALAAPSSLHTHWRRVLLNIANHSNQPIFELSVYYNGELVEETQSGIGPGCTRNITLALSEPSAQPTVLKKVDVEFTDAARTRWRRDGEGGLRQGSPQENGGWEWGEREIPVVQHVELQTPSIPTTRSRGVHLGQISHAETRREPDDVYGVDEEQ
jgi:hypothetical protein